MMSIAVVLFFLLTFSLEGRSKKVKAREELFCGVCEILVYHVEEGIELTKENHTVQTAFRMDGKKRTPYKRTEFRILEVIDNDVPGKLNSYNIKLRRNGRTGKKLVRIAHDKDSSKKVRRDIKRVFHHLLDEHLDELVQFFREEQSNAREKICVDMIAVCESASEQEEFETDVTPPPPTPPPPTPPPAVEANTTDGVVEGKGEEKTTGDVKENGEEKTTGDAEGSVETNTANAEEQSEDVVLEHKEL